MLRQKQRHTTHTVRLSVSVSKLNKQKIYRFFSLSHQMPQLAKIMRCHVKRIAIRCVLCLLGEERKTKFPIAKNIIF